MDRKRAGNPGRQGYTVDVALPRGRVVSDSDTGAPDYTRAPGAGVNSLQGPRRAGSRPAIVQPEDIAERPNMRDSSYFPEIPGRRTVRQMKKGGKVTTRSKKPAVKAKKKPIRK